MGWQGPNPSTDFRYDVSSCSLQLVMYILQLYFFLHLNLSDSDRDVPIFYILNMLLTWSKFVKYLNISQGMWIHFT